MKHINEQSPTSFKQAFHDFWYGFVDFEGKTTRAGYWWGLLIGIVTELLLISLLVISMIVLPDNNASYIIIIIIAVIVIIACLVLLIPIFTLQVRRLHDTGLNYKAIIGFYVLLSLFHLIIADFNIHLHWLKITIISIIILLQLILFIFMFLPSHYCQNKRYIGENYHAN